jgi:hypothetical protein
MYLVLVVAEEATVKFQIIQGARLFKAVQYGTVTSRK